MRKSPIPPPVALLLVALLGWTGAVSAQPDASYRVGQGDVIVVDVFDHEEVSGSFVVDEDGDVVFPYLGHVPVLGLTTSEIARLLERRLEQDYYVDVQLTVEMKEFRSRSVTVLGEVARPGTVFLKGRTTLTQVLIDAGGIRSSAGPSVEVRRQESRDGRMDTRVFTFATARVLSGEEGNDFEVQAGDIVAVQEKQQYFISGEIARPGQFDISREMTLMQAISQAGGTSKFASNNVEIHREVNGEKVILEVDVGRIQRGKAEDVQILPGDLIILKRRFF